MCFLLKWVKADLNISKGWPGDDLLNAQDFLCSIFITESLRSSRSLAKCLHKGKVLTAFLLVDMCCRTLDTGMYLRIPYLHASSPTF